MELIYVLSLYRPKVFCVVPFDKRRDTLKKLYSMIGCINVRLYFKIYSLFYLRAEYNPSLSRLSAITNDRTNYKIKFEDLTATYCPPAPRTKGLGFRYQVDNLSLRIEEKREIVQNAYRQGLAIALIAQIVGLTEDEIKRILENID